MKGLSVSRQSDPRLFARSPDMHVGFDLPTPDERPRTKYQHSGNGRVTIGKAGHASLAPDML